MCKTKGAPCLPCRKNTFTASEAKALRRFTNITLLLFKQQNRQLGSDSENSKCLMLTFKHAFHLLVRFLTALSMMTTCLQCLQCRS